ncbi:MAG: AraC family ligand binding domain-containing protein [Solirubrobacteraceae bacterium]
MERARYFRPPALSGVEALHANFVSHAYRHHSHPTWTIAVMRRGAAQFTVDGKPHRARAGELFVLEPETVHTGMPAAEDGWAYEVLYLSPELIADWAQRDRPAPLAAASAVFKAAALHRALDRLHHALRVEASGLELDEWVVQAADALHHQLRPGPRPARDRPEHAAVRRAVQHLRPLGRHARDM